VASIRFVQVLRDRVQEIEGRELEWRRDLETNWAMIGQQSAERQIRQAKVKSGIGTRAAPLAVSACLRSLAAWHDYVLFFVSCVKILQVKYIGGVVLQE